MPSPSSFSVASRVVFQTLAVAIAFAISPALQSQDVPAPDPTAILKALDQITANANSRIQNRRASALSQLQGATTSGPSAVDFYLQALEKTKYLENHDAFTEWRHVNQDLTRSLPYQNAALLQLRYLTLALQRSEKQDAFAQIPASLAYLNTLAAQDSLTSFPLESSKGNDLRKSLAPSKNAKPDLDEKYAQQSKELLHTPLAQSPVVVWLDISDLLPAGKDFAASAGSYSAIMGNNVQAPLREKLDPRLPGTWDTLIKTEADFTTKSGSAQQAEIFNKTRLPELQFKKAQDTALIGQPHRALNEVMTLIQTYPANPSITEWAVYARTLLTNAPALVPVTNATVTQPAHP